MVSILSAKQAAAIRGFQKPQIEVEGYAMSQQLFLSELPGVIFGVVTIVWIVVTLGLLTR
jgi:hypothetical protein